MKRIAMVFVILVFSRCLLAGDNEEFRATWVITWELINSSNNANANKALARKILDNHKKANMNAVLWQARQSGTAYYNSSYEPWGYYAGSQNPGYDPLAYAIQEAHARGLELHAWFNVFQCSSTAPGAPAAEHPEWVCSDRDGIPMTEYRSLSPGLAEVREYLVNVAMEIVRNYDIDGLHLDYVRWNEYSNSLKSSQLAKKAEKYHLLDGIITQEQIDELNANFSGRYLYDYQHPYSAGVPEGFSSWEDWWRWSVTEFVRVLHDSIQTVKPWVRLSVAALGKYNWSYWQGYGTVYQDAALWFNEGYIDQLTPMHYHWTSGPEFYNILVGGCPNCWGQYIQPGIDAGRLYTVGPGSYRLSSDNVWYKHPQIVQRSRDVSWVDGFQFFSYGSWEDHDYWEEAKSQFFNRITKIRATKLIVDLPPDAPSVAMAKLDSLTYQITVSPPVSKQKDQWFAIYRSEDDNFETDTDEIINVHFGNSQYTFTEQFYGTQDYNGSYYYFATMLDRFWNESEPSNGIQSNPLPSFAPMVVETTPADGDTVPVNQTISITFSKTMDVNSFQGAVSFAPEMSINELIWSDDHKSMTIVTSTSFSYATDYTLTIASTATDINGKPLDGNADGIGGDAFILHFRTEAIDVYGPLIVSSYPDYELQETDFAVDGVITFVFDEIVDPGTVNENSVILRQGENEISVGYLLTTVKDRSVLSVQPLEPLENAEEYFITLTHEIADNLGNPMDSDVTAAFITSLDTYTEEIIIDKFLSTNNWWQPGASGSTVGVYKPNTVFEMSTEAYLPASPRRQRISASMRYEWDESSASFLIREYLVGDQPRSIFFDTTYVLQCYVFGDGSKNKFRFCVDDSIKDQAPFHEVSKWITIDWYGWRIIEWKLNDPNSIGEWIGDGVLHGPSLRFDSFQLTHEIGDAVSGKIYFDNLRLVKKTTTDIILAESEGQIPDKLTLYQNYPNPFNPVTKIAFDIPQQGMVQLIVYDLLGREVAVLINRPMSAGHHQVCFDGSGLSSGVYLYRLISKEQESSKEMLLVK